MPLVGVVGWCKHAKMHTKKNHVGNDIMHIPLATQTPFATREMGNVLCTCVLGN